jgi:hypothetical protein
MSCCCMLAGGSETNTPFGTAKPHTKLLLIFIPCKDELNVFSFRACVSVFYEV